MKKYIFVSLLFVVTVVLISFTASAEDINGRLGIGLKGGFSAPTQDYTDGGDKIGGGPIVGGNVIYGLNNLLAIGFDFEWETHNVKGANLTGVDLVGLDLGGVSEIDIGDHRTLSLMPFVQIRHSMGAFTPFASIGAGININSFSVSDDAKNSVQEVTDEFCDRYSISCETDFDIDPDNTIAFKIGGGFDYFFTSNLAFTSEIGWKLNSGNNTVKTSVTTGTGSGTGEGTIDFNASVLTILFGIHYYF